MPPKTRSAVRKPRRKDRKNVTHGHAYIKSTFNNTIVSLTDPTALSSPGPHPVRLVSRALASPRPTPPSSLRRRPLVGRRSTA